VISEEYIRLEGLQLFKTDIADSCGIFNNSVGTGECRISYCIVRGPGKSAGSENAFYLNASNISVLMWNNVVYDFYRGFRNYNTGSAYLYNNTVDNCGDGYQTVPSSIVLKNNTAQNCTDGFNGTFNASSDYNISDISGDAPNTGGSGNDNTASP